MDEHNVGYTQSEAIIINSSLQCAANALNRLSGELEKEKKKLLDITSDELSEDNYKVTKKNNIVNNIEALATKCGSLSGIMAGIATNLSKEKVVGGFPGSNARIK